jgi:predicted transcriptional regulator
MHLPTGAQLRAARALLRLEKEQLAEMSGVSSATIRKLEAVDGPLDARTSTLRALQSVLSRGGVEFRPDGSVRLREAADAEL